MKIAFLLHSAFGIGGTIRTVLTQAESLASRHEVELVSVFRSRDVPRLGLAPTVRLSALVDLRIPAPPHLVMDRALVRKAHRNRTGPTRVCAPRGARFTWSVASLFARLTVAPQLETA
jgi:hypothetical protein